jgi:glutathione-regulated potassium-efflux system ancillary protein KefG
MKRKILILFAHPSQQISTVNVPLFNASRGFEDVTLVDLYQEYPTYRIDIEREQQRLLLHDVVVFMFPLYWYSTPAMLKEWQDLVLEYGFAYGPHGGAALKNKLFLCALTVGAAESAYSADGYNHFTIRELLRPLEQMSYICGMKFLAPFALFGALSSVEDNRVEQHIEDWKRLLLALRDDRVDIESAAKMLKINDDLDRIIREWP